MIRCLLKRSEPVTVIGQPVRWRTCPSSLHSALGHLVQAATERIIGAATRSSMACPVKRGFGDTAAHVLEYRSRCVTIAGRSQRVRLVMHWNGPFSSIRSRCAERDLLPACTLRRMRGELQQRGIAAGWSRRYRSGLRDRSAGFDRSWKLISIAALAAPRASW